MGLGQQQQPQKPALRTLSDLHAGKVEQLCISCLLSNTKRTTSPDLKKTNLTVVKDVLFLLNYLVLL